MPNAEESDYSTYSDEWDCLHCNMSKQSHLSLSATVICKVLTVTESSELWIYEETLFEIKERKHIANQSVVKLS